MTYRRMKDCELMMNQMEELDKFEEQETSWRMKTFFLYKLQLYLHRKILRWWTT